MTDRLTGIGASSGIAVGPVFAVESVEFEIPQLDDPAAALRDAASQVGTHLNRLADAATAAGREEAGDILRAQALMAEDPMLTDQALELIGEGMPVGDALDGAAESVARLLAASGSEYLAARADDVREISQRIARQLAGVEAAELEDVDHPVVVLAANLTVADTARMDRDRILGFATEEGGRTGHVAIVARSLGIPAVVGAAGLIAAADGVASVAIDGGAGEVVLEPTESQVADFAERAERLEQARAAAQAYAGTRVAFRGSPLLVASNVGSSADLQEAVDQGADGIGLFRTEFLFASRSSPPTEDEQVAAYAEAVRSFADPVIIRTLDVGADKQLPYLPRKPEENPFLGVRGTRLYSEEPELFHTQARALLRAATEGHLWIMLPMVATVGDIHQAREAIDRARQTLADDGLEAGTAKLGIMIEVPSAALLADRLADHVDFFSIGTNDLTQYTMAADRGLGAVGNYNDAAHPGVLRLCNMAVEAARRHDIPVGVCGEAAADPVTALLFAGMGVTELSVAPSSVNSTKAVVATADPDDVSAVLQTALDAGDAAQVRESVARLLS